MKRFFNKLFYYLYKILIKSHDQYFYEKLKTKYSISQKLIINGSNTNFKGKGKIIFGENTYIGGNCYLSSAQNYTFSIGENCAMSHNIRIYTNSYISDTNFNHIVNNRPNKFGNVIIGNGVWIGANGLIMPGVTIGNNSVVGANSLVIKDIPENVIASGTPCKVLRHKKNVN